MIPAVLNRRSTAALLGKVEFAFMKAQQTNNLQWTECCAHLTVGIAPVR